VLISPIDAPPFSSSSLVRRLSASERSPAGIAIIAEAPPESSTISRSAGEVDCATSSTRRAASTLRASGKGCALGCQVAPIGRPEAAPSPTPSIDFGRTGHAAANALSIGAAALPAATT
jgi:hypothetical protein